jgi:hypothetical protein
LAAKRKRNKKALETVPRRATANWIKQLDRTLGWYVAGGLRKFIVAKDFQQDGRFFKAVTTGSFGVTPAAKAAFIEEIAATEAPPVLSIATDQEGLQLSAMFFMKLMLNMVMVKITDPFHRFWNDVGTSVALSGLQTCYMGGIMIFNVGYGPWETATWWTLLLAQAADLAQCLTPDDPLVLKFWPRILRDRNLESETLDEIVGPAGRLAYIKSLEYKACLDLKSIKAKTSVWFSFHEAFDAWDGELNTRAMVFAFLHCTTSPIKSHRVKCSTLNTYIHIDRGGKRQCLSHTYTIILSDFCPWRHSALVKHVQHHRNFGAKPEERCSAPSQKVDGVGDGVSAQEG